MIRFQAANRMVLCALVLAGALAACGGSDTTPQPDGGGGDGGGGSGPTISSTSAGSAGGSASDPLPVNSGLSVTFSEAMDPATINASTFTLAGPGGAAVAGAVSYVGVTATFKPTADLAPNTAYTATITTGAKSVAGNSLAANYTWQVTTGAGADTTKPTVSSTSPDNAATGVSITGNVAVTFSKPINPATLTTATFLLKRGTVAIPGVISYSGVTATFNPTASLTANSSYTATIASVTDLAGNALAASYGWSFTTGATADTTAPTVASTIPADAATAVSTNAAITATFSEPMIAATLTTTTFLVTATGGAAVKGAVVYTGLTATFQPTAPLAASKQYTATITTAAKDLAGNALAANRVWSFTTGATADTTAPTVSSTSPLPAATGVLVNASILATFSEAMSPQSIKSSTFTVTGPGGAAVAGSVTYDAANKVATFKPTTSFAANMNYQAKIVGHAGGATDLAGNPLAADYTWGFTSGAHVGLSPVLLGSAGNFVILAKSAISTVPASVITGDIAVSPAAESFITGFALTDATGYATSPQVTGKIYAADQAPPTPSNLTTAVGDMQTAYTDAAGRPTPDFLELQTGAIGGLNLTPGLYKWTSTVTIAGDVTLTGTATDVWILQISGDLTMSSAKHVTLAGGAKARNVFWQVAGAVSIGTTAHFEGIILTQTAATMQTGSSINGRILAQTAVALDTTTVTTPAP